MDREAPSVDGDLAERRIVVLPRILECSRPDDGGLRVGLLQDIELNVAEQNIGSLTRGGVCGSGQRQKHEGRDGDRFHGAPRDQVVS